MYKGEIERTKWPYGWPSGGYPEPQGQFYCGNGYQRFFGREIMEAHTAACLHAGVHISGTNGEVMPGQAEYQVGPCDLLSASDQMHIGRFILTRICENNGVFVDFEPKPLAHGDWNGTGCHTNFSTKKMRDAGGLAHILPAIERLAHAHLEHIDIYGQGNEKRLTGKHETASMKSFTHGVGNRGASVRIPTDTANAGRGYLEDRRPAGNVDPYIAASAIASTTLLDDKTVFNALVKHYKDWKNSNPAKH